MKNGKLKKRTVSTWCGSRVEVICDDRAAAVLKGWHRRYQFESKKPKKKFYETLEYQLVEILSSHCGERVDSSKSGEGAVETLQRIIFERNRALEILALDRLREGPKLFL